MTNHGLQGCRDHAYAVAAEPAGIGGPDFLAGQLGAPVPHAGAGDAEQAGAVALRFAADISDVNSYARGELLGAAGKLRRIGAPQARLIRDALGETLR